MTRTRPPSRGTRKLSEAARHVVLPAGIVSTAWPAVEHRCRSFGIEFDEWQRGAGRSVLALNADGLYAADTTVLSIPRQVGKTFLLGAIVFALCLIHPGLTVIWTAHHSRTANETFEAMQGIARMPKVAAFVRAVRVAANEQGVHFTNGSRILFGAREHGFGRGFTGVDVLVFDEAQKLSERAMDNMVPTTNQASTGNPLILLAGTPPRPGVDDGDVFGKLRAEAIEAGSGNSDTLYIEFSADKDADLSDRRQWEKANPSYPHRTPVKAMLRMLKHLGPASFRREALGIWDSEAGDERLVLESTWTALKGPTPMSGPMAFGVKFSPDNGRVAMAVAVSTDDGKTFVEVVDASSTAVGIGPAAKWLAARWRDCDSIVVDGRSHAGLLVEALLASRVPARRIKRPTADDVITGSARLIELINNGGLRHSGQPGLVRDISGVTKRPIGNQGGWGFRSATSDANVTAVDAVALAISGLNEKPSVTGDSNRPPTGRRKATVM